MALFITSLNSGSNGNCYYIANDTEAVLIDAGLSCRETEKRLHLLGLTMSKIKAIFISHEHTDHIKGAESIAEKHNLPVFITSATAKRSSLQSKAALLNNLTAYEPVNIGKLLITAFPKLHDAADPHSFIITCNGITVGVFTDIGAACNNVTMHFSKCHAAFLEANYDEQLLEQGQYPEYLKNRIRNGLGHLSNRQALDIFTTHRAPFMTHLLLSHLSKNNNCADLVLGLFSSYAKGTNIIIATRYKQTPLYTIRQSLIAAQKDRILQHNASPVQLSLF